MRTAQRIGRELKALARSPPEGVRLLADENESVQEVFAEVTGPEGTPYDGFCFRMKLVMPADFPQSPPRGFFLTRIFHPNVSSNGDICVNTLKRDWQPTTTLGHILQVIRCLLIVPFPESSLNDEAGKLFMESYDEFARRARIMAEVHAIPAAPGSGAADAGEQKAAKGAVEDDENTGAGAKQDAGNAGPPAATASAAGRAAAADDENAKPEASNAAASAAAAPGGADALGKGAAKASRATDKKRASKKKNLRRL